MIAGVRCMLLVVRRLMVAAYVRVLIVLIVCKALCAVCCVLFVDCCVLCVV